LKDWQAYQDLKQQIDDFNESCPLLEMMAHKAMKARHWKKIGEITKHTFDVESEAFLLKNIMQAPLLENKEDIEVLHKAYAQDVNMTLFERFYDVITLE